MLQNPQFNASGAWIKDFQLLKYQHKAGHKKR